MPLYVAATLHPDVVRSAEQTTFTIAALGFMGVCALHAAALLHALKHADAPKSLGNALGGATCLVAGLHYRRMLVCHDDPRDVATLRYSDWYITTLLMILEFFVLSDEPLASPWLAAACAACTLMLVSGQVASELARVARPYARWFGAACAFGAVLAACFLCGTLKASHPHPWMYGFAATWTLYPLAFFAENNAWYNALDIVSKGVFGVVLVVETVAPRL